MPLLKNLDIDFLTKSDFEQDINEIAEIINSNIFSLQNSQLGILRKSAFIHLMILLRDLMYKSANYTGKRVSFTDDIKPQKNIIDVTDLIKYIRDAVVHVDSPNHKIDTNKISFNVYYGKGNFMRIGDVTYSSDYEDETSFFFGETKIYLNRHIIRAFNEARENFLSLD